MYKYVKCDLACSETSNYKLIIQTDGREIEPCDVIWGSHSQFGTNLAPDK